jgi:hypothetical protein
MLINDLLGWDCACGYGASVQCDEEVEKGAVAFSDLAILPCTFHEYTSLPSILTLCRSELQHHTASIEAAMIDVDKVSYAHILLKCPWPKVQEPQWSIVLRIAQEVGWQSK